MGGDEAAPVLRRVDDGRVWKAFPSGEGGPPQAVDEVRINWLCRHDLQGSNLIRQSFGLPPSPEGKATDAFSYAENQ